MLSNIYATIRGEVQDYTQNFIEVVLGWNFNTYETIKRCHSYYNSQFQDKTKISGLEKIFFNISKVRVAVASKLMRINPDDIVLTATNPNSVMAAFLLNEELKQWNREHHIERLFNSLALNAPIYGSVVVKNIKGEWDKGIVDLRRFALDPTCENDQDSRFITIRHYLTTSELRKMAKDNGWDKDAVEEVIRKDRANTKEAPKSYPMRDTNVNNVIRSSPYHEVWERYGEVPESWLGDTPSSDLPDTEELVRSIFIVANPFDLVKGQNGVMYDNGTVLFKSEWKKEWPFKDYHYDKTAGRWLGIGIVEDLFPAQERINEMANQKRISMLLSGMHIFQTQDSTIVQNILTDLQSGDVIRAGAQGGLTPLANEERNLQAYEVEEGRYDKLAGEISMVNSFLLGEGVGGRMTATMSAMVNQNASSSFEVKKKNLLVVLKEYYKEMILPQALKDLTSEHMMRFSGSTENMDYFDNEYAKCLADEKIVNGEVQVNGHDDYNLLVQTIVGKLKKMGKERWITIKEALYADTDFDLEFVTKDDETKSLALMQQSFQFLSAVAQNPALLDNPMVKPIFMKINTMMGIDPMEIRYSEQINQSNQGQPGQAGAQPILNNTPQQQQQTGQMQGNVRIPQQVMNKAGGQL